MARDGTFTGIYKLPALASSNGIYNISVRLDRTTAPAPISLLLSALEPQDSLRYALSIDQCTYRYILHIYLLTNMTN